MHGERKASVDVVGVESTTNVTPTLLTYYVRLISCGFPSIMHGLVVNFYKSGSWSNSALLFWPFDR